MKEIVKKISDNQLLIEVNKKIYEFEAILQTSYKFTDKCYINIDSISEDIIGVYFKKKDEGDVSLEEVVDKFCNELIDQQVRVVVERSCGSIRDEIVKKAFSPIN
ncbi:MAG: His-Xaa-Ser system protein HxsD [Proteobacteria bacterium]|nr:His-Xaa-Ser system protein HxsD [Pseudomonadota bacterium]